VSVSLKVDEIYVSCRRAGGWDALRCAPASCLVADIIIRVHQYVQVSGAYPSVVGATAAKNTPTQEPLGCLLQACSASTAQVG